MTSWIDLESLCESKDKLSLKEESTAVSKAILHELDVQIKYAEENLRKEQREKQETSDGDFNWLMTANRRTGPSRIKREQIEKLAMNLRPCDYNSFVNGFRLSVYGETNVTSVVRTLETMLKEYLVALPEREPQNRLLRLVRNLSNISLKSYFGKRSSKVTPTDHVYEDIDEVKRKLSDLFVTSECFDGPVGSQDVAAIDIDFESDDECASSSLSLNDLNIIFHSFH